MILLQGQNKSNEFYKMIMYIEKYPWMPIDDDRGRPRSVPDRPIRPSPSRLKMTAPFPSYPRTDGMTPSRPVLSSSRTDGDGSAVRDLARTDGTAGSPSIPSWHMNDGWTAVVCR